MTNRNLFDELMEGMDALQAEREGKVTLKRVILSKLSKPNPQAALLLRLVEKHPETLEHLKTL